MAEAYVWSRLQQHHQLQQLHQQHQLQQQHHHHHHQQQQPQHMQQQQQQQLHNQQQQQHSPVASSGCSSSSLTLNTRNSTENLNQDILFPPRQFTSGVASVPQTPSPESHHSSPINKSPTTPLSPNQLVVPQPVKPKAASGKSYQCKMCEQRFTTKSEAVQHTRNDHGKEEKRHKCPECVKSFPSSQQLAQHMLVHTNERSHHCEYCDKSFKQLSHLQQHRRRHTGERPYNCPMEGCELAFAQLSNLQQHVRNHANQEAKSASRDYQCEVCKRRFTTVSSLQKHSAKVHIHLVPSPEQMIKEVAEKLNKSTKPTKKRKATATTSREPTMVPIHYPDLQLRDPNLGPYHQTDQRPERPERPPTIIYPDLQLRDPNVDSYRSSERGRENRDGPSQDDLRGEGQGQGRSLSEGRGHENQPSFNTLPPQPSSSSSSSGLSALPPFSQALSQHAPQDSSPAFPRLPNDGDPRVPFHHFPLLMPPDRHHLGPPRLHPHQTPISVHEHQRAAESERTEERAKDK